jgi:hypothetical protein
MNNYPQSDMLSAMHLAAPPPPIAVSVVELSEVKYSDKLKQFYQPLHP